MFIRYIPKNTLYSLLFIPFYILFFLILNDFSSEHLDFIVIFLCWIGIIQLSFCIYCWKKATGGWFSLQTIFFVFAYLFNFGQCFLWAFGNHSSKEIGASLLYYKFSVTSLVLCKSQLITLSVLYALHLGMMLAYSIHSKKIISIDEKENKIMSEKDSSQKKGCILLFCIIVPISFYCSFKNLIISRSVGYAGIYYGSTAYSTNSILVLISMMFFSSIMSILIYFEKGLIIRKIAIISFCLLSLIQFASGDRGFVYQACIIFFWYMQKYNKKISLSKMFPLLIVGYFSIGLLSAVTSIRGSAFTLELLIRTFLSADNNPIVSSLLEMGASMSPLVAIVAYGSNPYPYGNTFLFTIPGMITENIISFLGIPYESLANWFSADFLGLSSGAAFSIVAEIYMNFGEFGGLIFSIALGFILGRIFKIDYSTHKKEFLSVAIVSALISIVRNTFQTGMKNLFWGVFVFYFLMYFINRIIAFKKK